MEEEEGEAGVSGSVWVGVCNGTTACPALLAAQPCTQMLCGRGRGTSLGKAVTPICVSPFSAGWQSATSWSPSPQTLLCQLVYTSSYPGQSPDIRQGVLGH